MSSAGINKWHHAPADGRDANEYGAVTAGIRLLEDSMITNANDPLDVILYADSTWGEPVR